MLTKEITQKIYNFVTDEPKTIQDISHLIGKSWLTTQRYLDKLSEEGVIGCKTFRGGTRGALKIIYKRPALQSISATQKHISDKILSGVRKDDFSPSDLFQFAKKREVDVVKSLNSKDNFLRMKKHFLQAEGEILLFSGDLSFLQYGNNSESMYDVIEDIAKRDISVKVLCRVELTSVKTVQKVLAINSQLGKNCISIKHCSQPLRADIIDGKGVSCIETFNRSDKPLHVLYKLYDKEWCDFLVQIFWQMYRGSISAEERIEFLEGLA